MAFQARFENGRYRDCKWCQGRGCISCPAEADKEYERQFPGGPQPIVTFETSNDSSIALLQKLFSASAIDANHTEAVQRASDVVGDDGLITGLVGCSKEQAVQALTPQLFTEVFIEKVKQAKQDAE